MNRLCRSLIMLQAGLACLTFATGAMAAELAKPDLGHGRTIATTVCAACHGADGNSATGAFPKLAGQHPEYLAKQLHDFKAQPGAAVPARNSPVMAGFAGALSEADARDVAAYYGAQAPQPGVASNAATQALARNIYHGGVAGKGVPACASCHGPAGQGIPGQYPRLAGQWADYTAAQLTAFQQGARNNNEPMHEIASRLSDSEVKALADYVAGLH